MDIYLVISPPSNPILNNYTTRFCILLVCKGREGREDARVSPFYGKWGSKEWGERARSEGRGIEGDRLHWEAPGFHIGSSPLQESNHIDWLNFSPEWDQCWCEFLAGCIHYSLSAVAKRRKRHKGSNGGARGMEWSGWKHGCCVEPKFYLANSSKQKISNNYYL